jgi:hypothetical protein
LEGYEQRDIYNADETGLFYNVLPDRTLALKGESCHGGKNCKDVSVDSHVATCGVETVQELCVSLMASGSVEGEEEEYGEPEVVPSFAETHEALMKVKSFFYAHSTSDSDRESVLDLEKLYFELRSKVCTKQTSMKDFLSKK